MKVTVKETKAEGEIKYPCLMIYEDGDIVLFESAKKGVMFRNNDSGYKVDLYSTCFSTDRFKPFYGTITLGND